MTRSRANQIGDSLLDTMGIFYTVKTSLHWSEAQHAYYLCYQVADSSASRQGMLGSIYFGCPGNIDLLAGIQRRSTKTHLTANAVNLL